MKLLHIILIINMIFVGHVSFSATCTAINNGNWTDPSTWSCGAEPGCGDLVIIPSGFTVIVDEHINLDENSMPPCNSPTHILVYGTLDFSTGKKIYLACGSSVEIMSGGLMDPGTGGGTSNLLEICQQEEWKAGDGPVSGYNLFGTKYPLALELISFTGYEKSGIMNLSWVVESEKGNDVFWIRFTFDGSTWNKVSVSSIGDHQGQYTYNLSVPVTESLSNSIVVELSATDVNGRTEQLDVISIQRISDVMYITPNPVGESRAIRVVGLIESDMSNISIIGVDGKVIQPNILDVSDLGISIAVDDLAPGTYFLKAGNSEPLRFVK